MIIILVIALLLFGGRKIPELARDIGTGIKEFRKSMSSNPTEDERTVNYDEPKSIEYQHDTQKQKKPARKPSKKA